MGMYRIIKLDRGVIMKREIITCISHIGELDIEKIKRTGIGVEIQDFTEPNLTDKEINNLIERYKELFRGFNHIKSMHGPFLDLKPSSPDLEIRKISQKRYIRAFMTAKELEMDYLIFHSQINPYLSEVNIKSLNVDQSREFWQEIVQVVNFKGTILIENIFEETPMMIKELIEAINLPNLKINLDIGHAKLGSVPVEEWIKDLNDHIGYIHIHTNNGLYDQHLRPTEGEVKNLLELLDKYNIECPLALEYKVVDLERDVKLFQ